MSLKFNSLPPDYFVYKKDDKWYKTDDNLTKLILARLSASKAAQLPKIVFYPNWKAEGAQNAKYAAWRVNEFGERVVRWYWKVGEHSKKCGAGCVRLDENRCGVKVPAVLEWSSVSRCWQLAPMSGKASDSEAEILEKNNRR